MWIDLHLKHRRCHTFHRRRHSCPAAYARSLGVCPALHNGSLTTLLSVPTAGPAKETRRNGLDKGKLPAPPQPRKQVVTDTTEPDSSRETEATTAAASAASGAKDAGTSSGPKVTWANDPSHRHLGGSTRAAMTNSLRSLMSSKVGQLFLRSVDRALDKSEELMNRYLPLTEKELAALTMEGLDASTADHHRKGCFVRLGSLSTSLRNRAFMLILNKLRQTRQNTHENLSQLHQTINLIEHIQQVKQLPGSQEKLHSMWEQWSQKQEVGLQTEPRGSNDSGSPEVESKTLAMSRSLSQQLQATYLNLLSNVRGLPRHLQEKMQQVHQNMAELHGYFSSANSFQDLSGNILSQSREKVAKAWEALDEVMDFLLQNPPVTWLVESLVSLEGELLETEEKPDILKVLKHYEPQDCKDD
nr:perilipin-3-like [Chelonoidis abingdonii]